MDETDVCPHGEFVADCPTCSSTCPHGYTLHECEDCLWELELDGAEKVDPLDVTFFEAEPGPYFNLESFLENVDTTPPREHIPTWREVHYDDAEIQARYNRRVEIVSALVSVLRRHGLPLHYEVLTRMVRDSANDSSISEDEILSALSRSKETFVRVQPGIYTLGKPRR